MALRRNRHCERSACPESAEGKQSPTTQMTVSFALPGADRNGSIRDDGFAAALALIGASACELDPRCNALCIPADRPEIDKGRALVALRSCSEQVRCTCAEPNAQALALIGRDLTSGFAGGIMTRSGHGQEFGIWRTVLEAVTLQRGAGPREDGMLENGMVWMEFHISRSARDRYAFDDMLFASSGNVVFASFHAARVFAQRMNERRDLVNFPEHAVKAGQINALGLIDEILHQVVAHYREQENPGLMEQALEWLDRELGGEQVDATLLRFTDEFPPVDVYRRDLTPQAYLEGSTAGHPHRQLLLEEMLMLWLANQNPAFAQFRELFDDTTLIRETQYEQVFASLYTFLGTQPAAGSGNLNLIDFLLSPARAYPHSLSAQLDYIREHWASFLGRHLYRLLSSLDLIQEEEKVIFFGPGPALVYEFAGQELEPERFSQDLDWMPQLVLIAKNAYVWLHQMSQKYKRLITRLDQIPDEELGLLARWGISGLWLIGLWERSSASRRIKQLTGNPEAVASAYSLYDYQVAADLGGEASFQNLKARAWQRGIRIASDMVPNHVGVYSRWVVEHPDWFISLGDSPFPAYSFTGPNISEDTRVGVFVEDHYYDRSDAAVVFRRVDRWTGDEKYIYHGNDGTSMPWNDTAQLNYLNPAVREAVIQTILHVARQTPIIRFDAAMTLTKKHFQRLWFPEPGTGGAIPSRADHGLTKDEFDAAMPAEFWREVVDRVAVEAPDTLLLAEAFWLLEGYFVRTLGMHRVYNSAFMNLLRDEDNAKYRLVMKNTLEFDPEILKRFVNFMNNPDEDTAVEQFGKGDKYFGICTLMATLPGLPMFGHGQIQGFAEKYGMEYRRAYWDEQPDADLVERHEREVFPLLHQRHLFAEVQHFLLYDFYTAEGAVNEDVFAYSNHLGEDRALVIYHNRFASTEGWIRESVAYSVKTGVGDIRKLVQGTLGEGLGLRNDSDTFYVFRDSLTGFEYIRNGKDLCEKGLFAHLDAYKCHVFLDWREVQDNEWHQYAHLADFLQGRGVPSIDEALREVFLQPVRRPFKELANAGNLRRLIDARVTDPNDPGPDSDLLDDMEHLMLRLLGEVKGFAQGSAAGRASVAELPAAVSPASIAAEFRRKLEASLQLPIVRQRFLLKGSAKVQAALQRLDTHLDEDMAAWASLLCWLFTHSLGKVTGLTGFAQQSRSWLDEWLLGKLLVGALQDLGLDEEAAWWAVRTVKILISHQRWFEGLFPKHAAAYPLLTAWLKDGEVQRFLQINRYQGVLWFNREAFEQLLDWMMTLAVVEISAEQELPPAEVARQIAACCEIVNKLYEAGVRSGYQVVSLLEGATE